MPPIVVARLEDRVGLVREAALQVVRGADAGQPGADDQDVEVFGRHAAGHRNGAVPASAPTHPPGGRQRSRAVCAGASVRASQATAAGRCAGSMWWPASDSW